MRTRDTNVSEWFSKCNLLFTFNGSVIYSLHLMFWLRRELIFRCWNRPRLYSPDWIKISQRKSPDLDIFTFLEISESCNRKFSSGIVEFEIIDFMILNYFTEPGEDAKSKNVLF